MNIDIMLLVLLVLAGFMAVAAFDLLKAAIWLALASAVLALVMFRMAAPLAAVFELSVCAGLITVVFVSVISLTRVPEREAARMGTFLRRALVPLLILAAGAVAAVIFGGQGFEACPVQDQADDVRRLLWGGRRLDLFGQVLVLLAGIFGVVVLFKERKGRE